MDFTDLQPLAGGWSGQTFLAEAGEERSVVRIYPPGRRPTEAPEIDAAVLRLVRGLLPVPEVLEVRRGAADLDRPGLLVTQLLPGQPADRLLPTLDDAGLAVVGVRLGAVAAGLAGMPTLRPGPFVDPDLTIGSFHTPDGLVGYVGVHADALTSRGWTAAELASLEVIADRAQGLLDTVDRTCLVHADLNPKNVLIDPSTLELTGLVDWEYAHSGHPATDLGNLLRFDRVPSYADAVLASYCEIRGTDPRDTLGLARAADLWSLVDLAARAGDNAVADRAAAHLRVIARTGDPHALPE